jgi:hypothetical protein
VGEAREFRSRRAPEAHHVAVDLPAYPATEPVPMPDESPARQSATALLVVEAVLLGLTLPVDVLFWVGSLWESDDPVGQRRLTDGLPMLGLAALVAAVLCASAAVSVWRDRQGALALTLSSAVVVVATAFGWCLVLRGRLADPVFLATCLVLSLVPVVALGLTAYLRRVSPARTPPR